MKKLISLLLFLFITNVLYGQISIDSISYKKDLQIFSHSLQTTHPNLYRFTTKNTFDSLFLATEQKLDSTTSPLEFYRYVSEITSLIRESHSHISPSQVIHNSLSKQELLPLQVQVKDSVLIIKNSAIEEYNYLKNATIHAINGKSIKEIIEELSKTTTIVSAYNRSGLKARLSLFNNFALAYYLFINTEGQYKIDYSFTTDPLVKTITLKGALLSNVHFPQMPKEAKPPFKLELDEKNATATIRVSTFAFWAVNMDISQYRAFFKKSFSTIRDNEIQNLIIDVRGNRGGDEQLVAELISYLVNDDFKIYQFCKTKTLDYSFIKTLPNAILTSNFRENKYIKKEGEYYGTENIEYLKKYKAKNKNNFHGKVYVLSDGICFSAANTFLALIQSLNAGIIIGQESGGAFQDVDGHIIIKFKLPFSKISVSYPALSLKLNYHSEDNNRGVIPHYITPTSFDNDQEMEMAYKLISQNKKTPDQ